MALAACAGMLFWRAAAGIAARIAAEITDRVVALAGTCTLAAVALGTRLASFLGRELVGIAAGMGRAAAFCGDLTLAFAVHRRKASLGRASLARVIGLICLIAWVALRTAAGLVVVSRICHFDLL